MVYFATGSLAKSSFPLPCLSPRPASSATLPSSMASSSSLVVMLPVAMESSRVDTCRASASAASGLGTSFPMSCSSMLGRRLGRQCLRAASGRKHNASTTSRGMPSGGQLLVTMELGGQYDETFTDVSQHLEHYFTYKAVRTVLHQLYEMNPTSYAWLHQFTASNRVNDSEFYLRALIKENAELGERVMVTRLHLFQMWIKKYKHEEVYKALQESNLEILRERLIQTVQFASDDPDHDR